MSWIETALIIILITTLFLLIINPFKKKTIVNYLMIAQFAMLLNHLMYDVVRWQLYPIYFVVSMLFMAALIDIRYSRDRSKKQLPNNRKKEITVISVALILSGIAIFAFPVYPIEAPSGEFEVGTATFELTDNTRTEYYGDNANSFRRVKVQFWYPAQSTKGLVKSRWLEDGIPVARALAKEMKLPFFMLDHTAKIMSNSYKNASVSTAHDTYPVIVLSHGWTGFRNLHTNFAELLASNGFIVIAIDHSYGAQIVVFDENDIALLDHDALPDRETTPEFLEYANRLVSTYASDVSYVIDQLTDFNEGRYSPTFTNRLNLDNIGLLGHSTGAGADVKVAIDDTRIKAVLGLDAWVEPIQEDLIEKGLNLPTLFLRSEQWEEGYNNANLLKLVASNAQSNGLIQINGTTHIDFSMAYMYSRLTKYAGFTGSVDQDRLLEIQYDMILSFFEATMKEAHSFDAKPLVEKWRELEIVN